MIVRKRIVFIVLCVVLLGWLSLGVIPALSSEAIPPNPTTHYSQLLGVSYKVVPSGFRLLDDSYFLFDDGYTLTAGDIVARVGMETCGRGKTLDGMIRRALVNGDRFMVIIEMNSGRRESHTF
jgi:hypothetical protein